MDKMWEEQVYSDEHLQPSGLGIEGPNKFKKLMYSIRSTVNSAQPVIIINFQDPQHTFKFKFNSQSMLTTNLALKPYQTLVFGF